MLQPFETIGSLSKDEGDGNEYGKRFRLGKQQLCVCTTLLCTFLSRCCKTTMWKCLFSRFVEDGNTRQQLSFSFPDSFPDLPTFDVLNEIKSARKSLRQREFTFKWRFRSRHLRCCLISLMSWVDGRKSNWTCIWTTWRPISMTTSLRFFILGVRTCRTRGWRKTQRSQHLRT